MELEVIAFATAAEFERWLLANHESSPGLWLKIAKKDSGIDTVSYAQALELALCFGWIDGQKRALDERFWLQRFTRRGPRSKWSRINREKAQQLLGEDRVRPAGLEQIERARGDGRWERAYEGQRRATVPDDLQRELDRNPQAKAFFQTLSGVNRYAILYRIEDAKRTETRERRIAKFIDMLTAGETIHP